MKWILLVSLTLLTPACSEQIRSPDIESLVKNHVDAINANSRSRYLQTVHPVERAETKKAAPKFFDQLLQRYLRKQIPDNFKISIRELDPDQGLMFEGMMRYPVRPTHGVDIDYEQDEHSSTSMILQAAEHEGHWYFVFGVPTEETIVKMKKGRALQKEQEAQTNALYAKLTASGKQAILEKVNRGQKIQAIKELRAEHAVDLVVAKHVVEKVMAEK